MVVVLKAIGIFAVAAVGRATAGFDVGNGPGFGANGAQKRMGAFGTRSRFSVVGLCD